MTQWIRTSQRRVGDPDGAIEPARLGTIKQVPVMPACPISAREHDKKLPWARTLDPFVAPVRHGT
jgi:hypothetical protein